VSSMNPVGFVFTSAVMGYLRRGLLARPVCPDCGSKNTATGRLVKLGAGFGVGIVGSILCYLLGFFYPLGRLMIPFLLLFGALMAITPSLGKYCCMDCDAYWNPETPETIWRPRPPGI